MMERRLIPMFVFLVVCATTPIMAGPGGIAIKGYDDGFSDSLPAVLIDIDASSGQGSVPPEFEDCPSGASPPNTVFSPISFTSGFAYIDDLLYGLEWDGGSGPNIYLYRMFQSFCAGGMRVGGISVVPVGFTNLESLVYCPTDERLYSQDFDFGAHAGRLIRIDPLTGAGELAGGPMATDIQIGGMTYDPETDTIYAVTLGFAARRPELLTINKETGEESSIGFLGAGIADRDIQSLVLDQSVSPSRLLAAGNRKLFQIDKATGAASPMLSVATNYNGTIWAMAAPLIDPPPPDTAVLDWLTY
jgi:hypothetical protein